MKAPEVLSKTKVYFFGILICLGGLVFGITISMFNNFFHYYIDGAAPHTLSSEYESIKTNLNLYYSLGFIPSALGSGWLIERVGRRWLILGLGLVNIIVCLLQYFPNFGIFYALRFFSGKSFE